MQLLIDRTDVFVDFKDDSDRSSLSLAAMNEHQAVMRLLLQHSNLKNHYNRTAIVKSARYDHETVMQLLLEHSKHRDQFSKSF
jgi:ankyrin repeat protein